MNAAQMPAVLTECASLARTHYENFPVASRLLPRRLRRPLAVIYAFARSADDLADEGERSPEQRLAALDAMDAQLDAIARGDFPSDGLFRLLAEVIDRHNLPVAPFADLLSAFRQDVTRRRYASFGELMDYCRRSANPVGRLVLALAAREDDRSLGESDAICSALQLINFLQDLGQDWHEHGRIYIPQDEMARFGVTDAHFEQRISDPAMRKLLDFQIARTRRLLRAGAPLCRRLGGRLGLEIRAIVLSGERVLERLAAPRADLFDRPRLDRRDRLRILWRALAAA